jgi:hypothetical protein
MKHVKEAQKNDEFNGSRSGSEGPQTLNQHPRVRSSYAKDMAGIAVPSVCFHEPRVHVTEHERYQASIFEMD